MSRDKDRFEIAEEQVNRFLGRIAPTRLSGLLGFPRKVDSIARAAMPRTTVEFRSLSRLSDDLVREVLHHDYKRIGDLGIEPSGDILMGRAVVLNDRCLVFSNPDFGVGTERFTQAHELGHLALDLRKQIPDVDQIPMFTTEAERVLTMPRDLPGVIPMDDGPGAPRRLDPKEVYANLFAAEILMPRAAVRERVAGIDDERERLAAVMKGFGVSMTAARVRLTMVGLRDASDPEMTLFEFASAGG